jgi:hypothetical protein
VQVNTIIADKKNPAIHMRIWLISLHALSRNANSSSDPNQTLKAKPVKLTTFLVFNKYPFIDVLDILGGCK